MANVKHEHFLNVPESLKIDWTNQPKKTWRDVGLTVISLIVPIIGALVGYYFVNRWDTARDQANKLEDVKIKYATDAFENLSKGVSLNLKEHKGQDELQKAFAKIQLFGSSEQIILANELVATSRITGTANVNKLAMSIKNELRKQLCMENDTSPLFIVNPSDSTSKEIAGTPSGLYVKCPNKLQYIRLPLDVSMKNDSFTDMSIKCYLCVEMHPYSSEDIVVMP